MSPHLDARARLAVTLGRWAGRVSRAAGRGAGTQVSGRVMLAVAPDLLDRVGPGRATVIVSATNGKTTTTRLLTEALRAAGRTVATNHTGANMASGVTAALVADPVAAAADTAVLEVDERWVPRVIDAVGPELLLLGNLSRDQLDRMGEVRAVARRWRTMLEAHPNLRVVANASDPNVVWSASPATVTWVALGSAWNDDAAVCPQCAALLRWDRDDYRCSTCGFSRPDTPNRLDGDTLVLEDEKIHLALSLPGRWNVMNAALAVTAAHTLGVDPSRAAAAMRDVEIVSGRFAPVALGDGRHARVLLAKNPAGWTEVLRWLSGRDAGVVLAVNAHLADGRDPSWLWDVPFELLAGLSVTASGERALDVAVRLDYGGVRCRIEPDPTRAARALPKRDVVIVASYTQFTALTRRSW